MPSTSAGVAAGSGYLYYSGGGGAGGGFEPEEEEPEAEDPRGRLQEAIVKLKDLASLGPTLHEADQLLDIRVSQWESSADVLSGSYSCRSSCTYQSESFKV